MSTYIFKGFSIYIFIRRHISQRLTGGEFSVFHVVYFMAGRQVYNVKVVSLKSDDGDGGVISVKCECDGGGVDFSV